MVVIVVETACGATGEQLLQTRAPRRVLDLLTQDAALEVCLDQ
jgi:hypothetical protein